MKNYKWDIKHKESMNLSDLYEREAMSEKVRNLNPSPKNCFEWLKKEEELLLDIIEINRYSSSTYGEKIGRYYFIEKGAEWLAASKFMQYAVNKTSTNWGNKPKFYLLSTYTMNENGIEYSPFSKKETEEWCDKKCEEYVTFVTSLDNKNRLYITKMLKEVHITLNMQYPLPVSNTLCLEINNEMTYGEFKEKMIEIFHIRPWKLRWGWKNKNQEEIDTKLLSQMGVSNGLIIAAGDTTIDQLSHIFYEECHQSMNWHYVKRPWQKINLTIKLSEVDNLPNFWLAVLEKLLDD